MINSLHAVANLSFCYHFSSVLAEIWGFGECQVQSLRTFGVADPGICREMYSLYNLVRFYLHGDRVLSEWCLVRGCCQVFFSITCQDPCSY